MGPSVKFVSRINGSFSEKIIIFVLRNLPLSTLEAESRNIWIGCNIKDVFCSRECQNQAGWTPPTAPAAASPSWRFPAKWHQNHQNGTRLSNAPPFRVERGTVATAVSPSTRLVFSLAFEFLSECLSLSFCQCNCHYILLKLFILSTKMDSSFRIK